MCQEYDVVALLTDVPAAALTQGSVGTIVHVYAPDTFEVEFIDNNGHTYALTTLTADQLLRLKFDTAALAA